MVLRALFLATAIALAGVSLLVQDSRSASVTFDDSGSDRVVLATPDYSVAFSKTNGAILDIVDARTGAAISQGSGGGCLWGAVYLGNMGYAGGCGYGGSAAGSFLYSWDAGADTLTLRFTGSSAGPRVDAIVTVAARAGPYFDLRLTLENHAGKVVRQTLFPSDLLFRTGSVQAGYLPYYLPGVRLKPAFFSGDHTNLPNYPSGNAFADYLALDVAASHLGLYSVNPDPNPVQPVSLGFIHNAPGTACQGQAFCASHSFQTWIPSGDSWTSPTVRVVIGQTVQSTIAAYRVDNGIDRYKSVAAKLGTRFANYARAPLIKADAGTVARPFRQWLTNRSSLPAPALIHPVGYMSGGHDHSYPDFLPPDVSLGSNRDFAAFVASVHAMGSLVMPYTNPTWWTDDSATLNHLPSPLTSQSVSVLDENSIPVHEDYGPNGGYVASPYVPFVETRLAQDMRLWQTAVPVDCIFEDQVGARPWLLDLNPASPTPLSYSQGWLEHTAQYQSQCLMTENGWDRLAATEVGFNGSVLSWERISQDPDQFFGAGNWDAFPLALWLFHDKVLLYQHNLALETMSNKPGVLSWNMAFGVMLSYNWDGSTGPWQNNRWLSLITWLQRDLGPLYAGQPLTGYSGIAPAVTQTTFPGLTILTNWNTSRPHAAGGTSIAPGGFLAEASDGSILAGSFAGRFNGAALSRGTHYFIVERSGSALVVRQPVGSNTSITLALPGQPSGRQVTVTAFDRQDGIISRVHTAVREGQVRLSYNQTLDRHAVAFYRVVSH